MLVVFDRPELNLFVRCHVVGCRVTAPKGRGSCEQQFIRCFLSLKQLTLTAMIMAATTLEVSRNHQLVQPLPRLQPVRNAQRENLHQRTTSKYIF